MILMMWKYKSMILMMWKYKTMILIDNVAI